MVLISSSSKQVLDSAVGDPQGRMIASSSGTKSSLRSATEEAGKFAASLLRLDAEALKSIPYTLLGITGVAKRKAIKSTT